MFARPRRCPRFWFAPVFALALLAGCSRVTPSPAAQPQPTVVAQPLGAQPTATPRTATSVNNPAALPTTVPVTPPAPPTVAPLAPTTGRTASERDELNANLNLNTWIDALETGDSDLGSYLYRRETGAEPGEVSSHIEALRRFIAEAEATFGPSLGFHSTTGNYRVAASEDRVGIALLQFTHATVCFRAEMVQVQTLWSIERWEPITWAACQTELEQLPPWVREEWRTVLG